MKDLSLAATLGISKKSGLCAEAAAIFLMPAPACCGSKHALMSLLDTSHFFFFPFFLPLSFLADVFP